MQKAEVLTTDSLGVPCVEVVSIPPAGSRKITTPFYTDQIEQLRETARSLRPREHFVVVPDGPGYSIFKKRREAKAS